MLRTQLTCHQGDFPSQSSSRMAPALYLTASTVLESRTGVLILGVGQSDSGAEDG